MANRSLLKILVGYERVENSSEIRFADMALSGSSFFKRRSRSAQFFSRLGRGVSRLFAYTSTRGYGLFFLGFGLLSLLLHFSLSYIGGGESLDLYVLVCGAIFSLIGVPLLAIDMPLFPALQSFSITDYVIFEFFCMKRMQNEEKERGVPHVVMLILGIMLAVVGAFVPLWIPAAVIVFVFYLFFTFTSPEFSLLSVILAMPFLSEVGVDNATYLAIFVVITFISFIRKAFLGKRVYSVEQYDIIIFLLLGLIFVSGIVSGSHSSFTDSLLMLILGASYPLVGSLISNRRLAECVVNSIVFSSLPVSAYSLYRFAAMWINEGLSSFDGVRYPFSSSSSLAAFLIVALIFNLYFLVSTQKVLSRLIYSVIFVLNVVTLCLTLSPFALVALLIAALVYSASRLRRAGGVIIAFLCALPYLIMLLPMQLAKLADSIPVLKYLELSEYVAGMSSVMSHIKGNVLLGSGIGQGYLAGAGNFMLNLLSGAGVFSFSLVLILFAVRLFHKDIYRKYTAKSGVGMLSRFTGAATAALVAYGAFFNVWDDLTVFCLFFSVFGIGSATLRIARHEHDDRADYYSDGSSPDSSAVDISLTH